MKNVKFLSTVGVVGLAGGLAWTPAHASNSDSENEEIVLEARGTFSGFRLEPRLSSVALPDPAQLPNFDHSELLEGIPVPPDPEIIARDDVGLDGSVDVADTQPSVVQLFVRVNSFGGVFFNCTGTVINPRTVLTAAHCLNGSSSEAYGDTASSDLTVLVASGVDTSDRIFNNIFGGLSYSEGGAASSTDVVIHPSSNLDNGGLPFPWADVALVALDEPITDVPSMPILLSPLTELTHVVQVGYGGFGTAETGDIGIGFLRRVGENMLGAVASPADLIDTTFPGFAPTAINFGEVSQAFYFTDFDNPFRTQDETVGCDFTGFSIQCNSLDAVRAIDWFDGDALPNEVATAPGDSGSPLIADELGGPPVVTGVLSGGFDFFGIGNTYGDISFYTPLYPFFEFISENTPYKYVSAKAGDGKWSDPDRWTQDLDPGFLIDDGTGTLINGLPSGPEKGVFETGPKLGTILGVDISGNPGLQSIALPNQDTPNFGPNLPQSSNLVGPGSTGFVPNNTDGSPGTAFENPAQYFDVILNRGGTTKVDIDVEIDKLTLANNEAKLFLPERRTLTTIIGYEQFAGTTRVEGSLNTPLLVQFGGIVEGAGTITTDVLFNIAGGVAPGGLGRIGTLTVDGVYVQTSGGSLVSDVQFRKTGTVTDLLMITGDAGLAGNLFVHSRGKPRYGEQFTVLSANSTVGRFDDIALITKSPILFATPEYENGDVRISINARKIGDMFEGSNNLSSVGEALDTLRFGGQFAQFVDLFDIVDNSSISTLIPNLVSLTPVSAFGQSTIATSFSNRFTGQLSQRTLSLRGASKGAGGFSAAGNAGYSIAETDALAPGELGFFGTLSGSFLHGAELDRNTGSVAFEEANFSQAGEMTLGVDMRVTRNFTIGVAMTNIRSSGSNSGPFRRQDDSSSAGAAYAAMQLGKAFADIHAGYARQNFGVERASQGDFNLAYGNAFGASRGEQTFAGMRVGYAFDVAPGLEMGPVASIDYVHSEIDGYREYGAGSFGLDIHDRSFTSLGTKIGAMASLDTKVGRNGRLSAFGSVAYARELADTEDVVTASFIGARDVPFTISNGLDPEWISVNAGAELELSDRFSIRVSGTSDFGRGALSNNEGRFTMRWTF